MTSDGRKPSPEVRKASYKCDVWAATDLDETEEVECQRRRTLTPWRRRVPVAQEPDCLRGPLVCRFGEHRDLLYGLGHELWLVERAGTVTKGDRLLLAEWAFECDPASLAIRAQS